MLQQFYPSTSCSVCLPPINTDPQTSSHRWTIGLVSFTGIHMHRCAPKACHRSPFSSRKRSCLSIMGRGRGWSTVEQRSKRINHVRELPSEKPGLDIPELSENCGTSQTTAVSMSVAWTVGGDRHLSITGGSVSWKGYEVVKGKV